MRISAETVFDVQLSHPYFGEGDMRGAAFKPLPSALELVSAYSGKFLLGAAGFKFALLPIPGTSIPKPLPFSSLCFSLNMEDSGFINYTDLPFSRGKIWYWNNLHSTKLSPSFLHLDLRKQQFSLSLQIEKTLELEVEINDLKGTQVKLQKLTALWEANTCPVDLKGLPEGAYQIKIKNSAGKAQSYECFASDSLDFSPPLGVFEWYPEQASQPGQTLQYQLDFPVRNTFWRYYLSENPQFPLTDPKIGSFKIGTQTIGFSYPAEATTLPDGKAGLAFTSLNPIPLLARPNWPIVLTAPEASYPLPYASDVTLESEPAGPHQAARMISNIYVFL